MKNTNITLNLQYGDILVIDPCYIKSVYITMGGGEKHPDRGGEKEVRFDLLRTLGVIHEGDDGSYLVSSGNHEVCLGVDSGRIWSMLAETEMCVEIDAGMSGYMVIPKTDDDSINDMVALAKKIHIKEWE